jgi:N utilization substance protein A
MRTHPDDILRLQGIGPKAMSEINKLIEHLLGVQKAAAAAEAAAALTAPAAPVVETPAAPPTAVVEPVVEEVQPQVLAGETALEKPAAPAEESKVEVPVAVAETPAPEVEEEATFDTLFTLKPDMVPPAAEGEEEEESDDKKKKKKKSRKSVEITYDPDRDLMLTKKKHKRGDGVWEWEE